MCTPCCLSSFGSSNCCYVPCPPNFDFPLCEPPRPPPCPPKKCEPCCPPPKPKPTGPAISFVSYPVCPNPTCPLPKLDDCPTNRMVCFASCYPSTNGASNKSKEIELQPCKSFEFIGGKFIQGCDCGKHNGLQDSCRRTECRGTALCRARQWACCRPSRFSGGKHYESKLKRRLGEDY